MTTQYTITGPQPPISSVAIRQGLTDTAYNFDDYDTALMDVGAGLTLNGVTASDAIMTDAEFNAIGQTPYVNLITFTQTRWLPDKFANESDYYGIEIDSQWLGEAEVDSVSFAVAEDSNLAVQSPTADSVVQNGRLINRAYALLSGGNVGTHQLKVTLVSGARTKIAKPYIIVRK